MYKIVYTNRMKKDAKHTPIPNRKGGRWNGSSEGNEILYP